MIYCSGGHCIVIEHSFILSVNIAAVALLIIHKLIFSGPKDKKLKNFELDKLRKKIANFKNQKLFKKKKKKKKKEKTQSSYLSIIQ